ncbi:TolC family protein [Reichenbachiella agarivorans]|uniref:TolC family protein n=1 Tax=Reichenbachiella agarivorans TaxID=2979464 RepID=A0ABY6CPA0_9BACT|nr:TolC family protein [Reichenbachiella agarivorans]UXP31183.1 TolC family protein [Reichenbachiella agarivorans]
MRTDRIGSTVLTMVLLLIVMTSRGQDKTSFSLEEAVNFALLNNQTVKNAKLEMEIAERQVDELIADGLPQVNANMDLGYNYKIQRVFLPGDAFDPNGDPNAVIAQEFGTLYSGTMGISATQMIFDGSFFVGLKAAKTFTELSKKDLVRSNIDVAEAVSKAYFGVLVNVERYELIKSNYSRVDSLLRDTDLLYKNGMSEKIDVSRVKVQYNNLKVEMDNYQAILDYSKSILKFQMGLDPKSTIELTEKIQDVDYFQFDQVQDFQYENRIEYAQLNINKQLNELDIRNVNSGYAPTLNAYGSYGRNSGTQELGDLVNFTGNYWQGVGVVGLKLSMPIFDGLRKSRQVQQRKLKGEQIKNQFEQLEYSIDLEIEQAMASYNKEIDNIKAQKENMELAREVYDVAKTKYEEGVGSNIEVIDADREYKQAQTNYYNAVYDALISKVELQKAYGVLL